jgi:hypothetical protein
MAFRSAQDLWNSLTHSNPIGAAWVADLSQQQVLEVQKALEGKLRQRAGESSTAVLTNMVNIAIGTA